MSDISEADSDDIANLLGDVDELDNDLFGIKPSKGATPPRKISAGRKVTFAEENKLAFAKQDRVGSENDLLSSKTPKNMQETTGAAKSSLDDLLGFGSTPKRKSGLTEDLKIPQTENKTASSGSNSNLDDLFGPAPRRGGSTQSASSKEPTKKKAASDWLGIGGGGDSDEDGGSAFQELLAKRKKDTTPLRQQKEPEEGVYQPKSLPFLEDPDYVSKNPSQPPKNVEQQVLVAQPSSQPQAPVQQFYQAEIGMGNQNLITRLTEENGKLEKALEEQRKDHWEEKQRLILEMKEKVATTEREAQEAITQLKKLHREALDRLRGDHDDEIEKLKLKMGQEVEAAASAYEHTKNYREVVSKVDSALEQLSQISGKVVDVHDEDTETREIKLREREEHVKRLQERLDRELGDLHFEKEKTHKLLERLEITVTDQEKNLDKEKWQLEDKKNKFEMERSSFNEIKGAFLAKVEAERTDLNGQKQSFLMEQETLLRQILGEQERLQQEKLTFQIQKDSDLKKIKEEALLLQQKINFAENVRTDSERSAQDYGLKQKKLLEMEQRLRDEGTEIQERRIKIDRDEENLRMRIQDLSFKEAELGALGKESVNRRHIEETRVEAQKLDLERRNLILKEKSSEILEKQRDLFVQQEKLLATKEHIERLKEEAKDRICPKCAGMDGEKFFVPMKSGNINNYLTPTVTTQLNAAEKPLESTSLHRKGSIRSTLRQHTKELEKFLKSERAFLQGFD